MPIGIGAGLGTRMKPYKVWKELLNVGYQQVKCLDNEYIIPKVLSEYTFENMIEGGAENFILVINELKNEIMRYYSNGRFKNINISYVCQDINSGFYGLPIALYEGVKLRRNGTVAAIYDKPAETNIYNTWNIAIWGEKFINLLIELVEDFVENEENMEREIYLSDIFNLAIEKGYRVYGKLIDGGVCIDFGNINTFVKYKVLVENKGVSAEGRVLWNE